MKKYKVVFQPHPREPVKIMELGAMNILHLIHRCEKDFSIDVNKITVIKQIIPTE